MTIKYFNDEIKAVNIIKKVLNTREWYGSYGMVPISQWDGESWPRFFFLYWDRIALSTLMINI